MKNVIQTVTADAGSVCHAIAEFFWETSLYCVVENQLSSKP